jgi:hypothetical protein
MASKLFLVDLDLNLNKAKNFRVEDFSTNPSTNLESGRLVYFTGLGTSQNHFKAYNGTTWKTLAYTDDVPTISISLDAPDLFSVSGSPADASGTLAFEWNNAAVNTVLAGPGTGSTSAIPTFRSLVDADIPVEIARVDDLPPSGEGGYIPYTEKGEPLGVAELDANGYVPAEQLDLSSYVTLTGVETLTNKTFNDYLSFTNPSTTPVDGTIGINDTNENFEITALVGNLILGATDSITTKAVVLNGTAGEFLNDPSVPGNQIATIADLDALPAYDITSTQISNWDTAYGWGDHSVEGYLKVAVESITNADGNITFSTSTGSVTADLATDIEISGDLIVQGDLTVNGDVTTLNTATMNVEDNIFVLNSNVTGTPSVDAGLEVERGTYTNASIYWDESNNFWSVSSPNDTSGTAPAFYIARKWAKDLSGSATSYTLTHNLGTRDLTAQVYETASPYAQVETAVEYTSLDTITIYFNTAPADGAYRVVVTG